LQGRATAAEKQLSPPPPPPLVAATTTTQRAAMLTYLPLYRVLICDEHQHTVYSLDEHLKRHHKLPAVQRRELLALCSSYTLLPPDQVPLPELLTTPFTELAPPQDAWLCCSVADSTSTSSTCSTASSYPSLACRSISTSCTRMRKHVNQQHSIHLTRWSTPSAASYAEHAA
jgi:hypothetical protein